MSIARPAVITEPVAPCSCRHNRMSSVLVIQKRPSSHSWTMLAWRIDCWTAHSALLSLGHPLGRVSIGKRILVPNSSLLGHFGLPEKSFLRHYSNLLFRSADFGTITQWIPFPIEGDPFSHPSGSSAGTEKALLCLFLY